MTRMHSARLALVLSLACAMAGAAFAQPSGDVREALARKDFASALSTLDGQARSGDARAKGQLSYLLLNLPAPYRDPPRGCAAAKEASAAGDAAGEGTLAQCILFGVLGDPQPLRHGRDLARAAMKHGDPNGAFMVYAAFAMDPANSYLRDGKPDAGAYEALAARPLAARAGQSEALDALAYAATHGHPVAGVTLATYFYETVAPANVVRLKNLLEGLAQSGERSPQMDELRQRASQIAATGDTKTSVRAFMDSYAPALTAAKAADAKANAKACDELRLASIRSGELRDPVFLPQERAEMQETYLVRGTWDEAWTFQGCGREAVVRVSFAADGWGGARFQAGPPSANSP